jgi:hypothetical protein
MSEEKMGLADRLCQRCGHRPYTIGVSDPHHEGQDWLDYRETLFCDDCYIAAHGRAPMPRGHLS